MENKGIEARWRQRCIDSKNSGGGIPPMPEYVEAAQDFLIKYRNGIVETHKRFVVTLDGRSFDTKVEARKHIGNRYPTESAEWAQHVNDTRGDPDESESDGSVAKTALEEIAAVHAEKMSKKIKGE